MTRKPKIGRPKGTGQGRVYTVRRNLVLSPEIDAAWREMCARVGGMSESAHIREALKHYLARFALLE